MPFSMRHAALLLAASSVASARQVTFGVVSFGTGAEVSVGGANYQLTAPWPADPYYNGTVEVPDGVQTYKYVVDGKPEAFERPLDGAASRTMNDFYSREVTYQAMPQFRAPFDDPKAHWTRQSKAEIFDDGYIPTVHFSGQAADGYMVSAEPATVDVLFIGRTHAVKYTGVAATAKNTEFAKAQLKVDFQGDVFYGRSSIKLRNSETDATMMREQLYGEMLRAAGAPVQESVKARVYYNKKEYGLLELQDVSSNDGFIAELFYGNGVARPQTLGVPLECSTGADFSPNGPYDAFQQLNAKRPETNSRVADLSKALAALDVANADAVAEFEKSWFDIESFFKAMAMEYLAGHWDSYWYFSTNFVVYDDPAESAPGKFKFYFIDQDFDQTFGVAFGPPYNNAGAQATSQSYKDLVSRQWKLDPLDAADRTMVNKLLKAPSILAPRFEKILTGIVREVFNPDAVRSRLDALSKRYRPEIEWDRRVARPHAGLKPWTIQDFDAGLNAPVGPIQWGLTQWVEQRATAVSREFNFEWNKAPLVVAAADGASSAAAPGAPARSAAASHHACALFVAAAAAVACLSFRI